MKALKIQQITMGILGALTLILLVVVIDQLSTLSNVNAKRRENENALSSMNVEISKESVRWETFHNDLAQMQKASASYEAAFQKEDRAEAVRASMEEAIASLNALEYQQIAQKEQLRAIWESLCDRMNIAYETEEATEPDGDYDE